MFTIKKHNPKKTNKTKMKKFLILSCLTLLLSACNADYKQKRLTYSEGITSEEINLDEIVTNFGNGVFYFKACSRPFGECLSAFLQKHPGMEIVSITPNLQGYEAFWAGYTVVFNGLCFSDETLIAKENEELSEEDNVTE